VRPERLTVPLAFFKAWVAKQKRRGKLTPPAGFMAELSRNEAQARAFHAAEAREPSASSKPG
jgi:hypothetical protein